MCEHSKNWLVILLTICLFCAESASGQIVLYVDADAPGTNNGTDWANAYTCLFNAVNDARETLWEDSRMDQTIDVPIEIRVAKGIYLPIPCPSSDFVPPVQVDHRTESFRIPDGMILKGGYAGIGESNPHDRNIGLYETILSGDLNGNDAEGTDPAHLLNEPTRTDNSYNVISRDAWFGSKAILDGFKITGGNSNIDSYQYAGAGAAGHELTIVNCTFVANAAVYGGALCNGDKVVNCTFYGNYSINGGAVIAAEITSLNSCVLWNNGPQPFARYGGGRPYHNPDEVSDKLTVSYSNIHGGWQGIGNKDSDPAFANAEKGDFHLQLGSPCIDTGDPDLAYELEPLPNGGRINMGAYGNTQQAQLSAPNMLVVSTNSMVINEGTMASLTVALLRKPDNIIEMQVVHESGDQDIMVQSGSTLIFDPSNYSVPQTVTLVAQEDDDKVDGQAVIWIGIVHSTFLIRRVTVNEKDNDTVYRLMTSSTGGGHVVQPGEGVIPYSQASSIHLEANPDLNYHFVSWTGTGVDAMKVEDPMAAQTTMIVDGDYSVHAEFAINQHVLKIASTPGGSVIVPGEGIMKYGHEASVMLQVKPESGYSFSGWTSSSIDARVRSSDSGCTAAVVDSDFELVANFTEHLYNYVLYVDAESTGNNTGTSWANAYTYLQDAFAMATFLEEPIEIRVAEGTYEPDRNLAHPDGNGDRKATFKLINNVSLKGGYAGFGTIDPNARNIDTYVTILSGDLNRNDDPNVPIHLDDNHRENACHVVTSIDVGGTTELSGFTVSRGNAYSGAESYSPEAYDGGGMFNINSDPIIRNCRFCDNYAVNGGGLYNSGGSPTLINCTFFGNAYPGMFTASGKPSVIECTFTNNRGYDGGGLAIASADGDLLLTHCSFLANTAGRYGGAFFTGSTESFGLTFNNCKFDKNLAQSRGGAVYLSTLTVPIAFVNCVFKGNLSEGGGGGGIANHNSDIRLINCVFSRNNGKLQGGAILNSGEPGDGSIEASNCVFVANSAFWGSVTYNGANTVFRNCILWGNTREVASLEPGSPTIIDSLVHGGWQGDMRYDFDPLLTPDGHLSQNSPCINLGSGSVAQDPNWPVDLDAEKRVVDIRIDMGPDEFIDSDADGLPDWWEQKYFGDPNGDPDNDGLTNMEEYQLYSSDPNKSPLYVDPHNVNDPLQDGTSIHPFASLQAGIDAAIDGDTILAGPGIYSGLENMNLDFAGKPIVLKSLEGSDVTVIDCQSSGRGVYFHSNETAGTALVGFTIMNGNADIGGAILCENAQPQIRECVITNNTASSLGGGLYCSRSILTLADCAIGSNVPNDVWMEDSNARIFGKVELMSGYWEGKDVLFTGSGILQFNRDCTIHLDNSRIRCRIEGPGTIQVDLGSALYIESNAIVDLSHATDPDLNGQINCGGLLQLKDFASVLSARVDVLRADFGDNTIVSNCVVNDEAGGPYGQFYIDGNASIWLDRITSDGDRYLDLDPAQFDVNNIHVDVIEVGITEGVEGSHGGLFELRGTDLDNPLYDPDVFFCQMDNMPGFSPTTWTIDRLELVEGAKLNLTNRFDFQYPYNTDGGYEVLYVKNLILGPDSVLNTAYNRLYYENLIMAPTAQVINVPLLGFSLNNITFDDENDYIARVKHNNFLDWDPISTDTSRIHVKRIDHEEPDTNGMMQMCNLVDTETGQLHHARAKALFAKSNESEITVLFEYLFSTTDPNVELVIYLSDVPELLMHNDPARDEHYVEVARLMPPPVGRPGSKGSNRFGVFQKTVARGDLNFVKGTRIEFGLIGPAGTCVLINNWDPQVYCSALYCGDVTGDTSVNVMDLLTVVGGFGGAIGLADDGDIATCLEGSFSADGTIDSEDLLSWDWRLNSQDRLNFCSVPFAEDAMVSNKFTQFTTNTLEQFLSLNEPEVIPSDLLLIAGKRGTNNDEGKLEDRLYMLDSQGQYMDWIEPAVPRGTAKLLLDSDNQLYELNIEKGVMRASDKKSVVPPASFHLASDPRHNQEATVHVGLQNNGTRWWGRPLLDAAFDAEEGNLYIAPVVVAPAGQQPYTAVAQITLQKGSIPPYELVRLYDDPPLAGDNQKRNSISEVEVDDKGNLYVINSHYLNESDILWIYDIDSGSIKSRLDLTGHHSSVRIPAPTALFLSQHDSMLYLASAKNPPQANSNTVYGLSTETIELSRTITINNMGHITDIGENPATGTLWVVGFTMENIPEYLDSNGSTFYKAYMAKIPVDSEESVQALPISGDHDLALPLSVVWTGGR